MESVLLNVNVENKNSMVVLGTSYHHPISSIFEHEQALRDAGFVGPVLIDGLMSTGFASNRFLKMEFDGQHFDYMKEVEIVDDVSKDQLKAIYNWFFDKENVKFLEYNAILPDSQKYILKKGLLLKWLGLGEYELAGNV